MQTIFSFVLLLVLSSTILGQSAISDAKLIEEARAFERELITALRNGSRESLERMVGEGFVFIHSTGPLETRDEYITNAAAGNLLAQRTEMENLDQTWRAFEGSTVIRYNRTVMRNKAAGTETRVRNIAVFVKTTSRGWQWVYGQSTRLPVRPKAAGGAKMLDIDIGVYEIGSGRSFTVTKEKENFYGQTTGRLKMEIIPVSDTSLILFNEEIDPGYAEVVIVRGDDGKMNEIVYRLNGQQVWRAKKVK